MMASDTLYKASVSGTKGSLLEPERSLRLRMGEITALIQGKKFGNRMNQLKSTHLKDDGL